MTRRARQLVVAACWALSVLPCLCSAWINTATNRPVAGATSSVTMSASATATTTATREKTWSNPQGLTLTPIDEGVWGAERPFMWNSIDVGGRSVIIKLKDGSLWVHSPVQLDEELRKALGKLGPVSHIVSPNFEHVKYAQQWIEAYPGATAWACPGLKAAKPDINYSATIGDTSTPPPGWPAEIEYLWMDCERVPVLNKAFFNEVVFMHAPSRCLMVTDVYWNYPCSVPPKSKVWKTLMDVIYLPVYRKVLVSDLGRFDALVKRIEAWPFETIAPCHGTVVREGAKAKLSAFLRRGRITKQP